MNIMHSIGSHHQLIDTLEKHAQPLGRTGIDYDTLIQAIRRHSEGKNLVLMLALRLLTPHPLLLMDEPFDGFDLRQIRTIVDVLDRKSVV